MRKTKVVQESELDPWTLFLNAMRAPMTRDRYQTRVAKFFHFIGVPGKTLEQKARIFANKGKIDTNWALGSILKFVYFQRERVDKTTKPVEKEIKGIRQLEEMAVNLIRHFCELNPEMVQPLISGSKSNQGISGKVTTGKNPALQEEWNKIKGLIDINGPTKALPVQNKTKERTTHSTDKKEVPIQQDIGNKDFLVKSSSETSNDNIVINLKFIKVATNQDDPVIYFEPPNRIVINTARPSAEIILTGNPKDPTRKAIILPLLTMAIVDMLPSTSQLSYQDWKKCYGQLLDKGWVSC